MNIEKLQDLKEGLSTVVQYCHDNDKDFLERFCSIGYEKIESLNAVYLSGSSGVMMITHWHHDELFDKTVPIITQQLLEWIACHQSTKYFKA